MSLPIDAIRSAYVRNSVVDEGHSAADRWNVCDMLDGSSVRRAAEALFKDRDDIQYVKVDVIASDPNRKMELPKSNNKNYIYIDFELAGFIDHIVTMRIDTVNKKVEYYDSQGLTVLDRPSTVVRGTEGVLLPAFVEKMVKDYGGGGKYRIDENTEQEQSDLHSCGLMVSIRKAAWLNNTEEGHRHKLAAATDEVAERKHFINMIKERLPSVRGDDGGFKDSDGDDF